MNESKKLSKSKLMEVICLMLLVKYNDQIILEINKMFILFFNYIKLNVCIMSLLTHLIHFFIILMINYLKCLPFFP